VIPELDNSKTSSDGRQSAHPTKMSSPDATRAPSVPKNRSDSSAISRAVKNQESLFERLKKMVLPGDSMKDVEQGDTG
jgi:hypothetical protein